MAGMTRILVIHTGGTIGMVRSAEGFRPARGLVEAEVARLCEGMSQRAEITLLDPLIDSANATPGDWNRIAAAIEDGHDRFDAFLVTHGTDTLAYTAAALALALEGLARPVVLTGAMLPLGEEGSDGGRNLSDALAACADAPPGVWVQFAGRRLHGARIRKTHSSAFDAFAAEPADMPPLRAGEGRGLIRHVYGRPDVAVLPVVPGGAGNILLHAAEVCDGLVLRCFGSGTIPGTPHTEEALALADARGIPLLAVSQCPEGGIALGTYAAGAMLLRHNAVDGRDMTVEAAYAKMTLALARGGDIAGMRRFLATPLCGEARKP